MMYNTFNLSSIGKRKQYYYMLSLGTEYKFPR